MKLFYSFDPIDPPRYHKGPIDGDYFDWLFSMLARTGLTFVYRCNLAGHAYYPSQHMASFDHDCVDPNNPEAQYWHRVAGMMDIGDPLAEAVRAARKHDVPIWTWFNWNEFQCIRRNWVYLADPVWYENPRKYWSTRDGSRFYHGIADFGDEQVQQRLLSLTREISNYDVDGMYLSTRSHSWRPCWASPGSNDHLELFGFNDSTVRAYQEQHSVDIRYDDFDEQKRLKILGDQFSQVISQTGQLLHQHHKSFIVGISPNRYELCAGFEFSKKPSAPYLRLYKDWERWVAEGWIDGLCSEQSCPHEACLVGSDITPFQETLPNDFPLYTWADTAHFVSRIHSPFSLVNWDRRSSQEVIQMIENARSKQAAGIVLHSLYHFTSADTQGESIGGYGVLPRTEYFEALKRHLNTM